MNELKHELGYMVHVSNHALYGHGKADLVFLKCVESFLRHTNTSQLLLYTLKNQSIIKNDLLQNPRVIIKYLDKAEWDQNMMNCKIKTILNLQKDGHVKKGSRILVLDSDLFFQANPFAVFENSFDVFLTSRNARWEENFAREFPVNGGVWGFRYNEKSEKFLQFYVDNLYEPNWPPYVDFRKNYHYDKYGGHVGTGLKGTNQDFLCVIFLENEKGLVDFIKLYDATYKYNYCPPLRWDPEQRAYIEDAEAQDSGTALLEKGIGDVTIPILHLKGGLKGLVDLEKL